VSDSLVPVAEEGCLYGRGTTAGGTSEGGGGAGGATAAGAAGARVARRGAAGGGGAAHPMTVLRMPKLRHSRRRRATIGCLPYVAQFT